MCTGGQYDPDPEESPDLFEVPEMAELLRIWSVLPADPSAAGRPTADFDTVFRVGLGLALALLDDSDPSGRQVLVRLELATARWAREQVPIELIQHAVHEGVKNGLGLQRDRVAERGADDVDGAFVVDVLDTLTATVSRAYVAQLRDGRDSR